MSGYDIIGDIHAQATRLETLLQRLGYHGFKHPNGRKIIFLGDFIDRGIEHAHTINLVRGLIDEGTAQTVMGNHEFNAICFSKKGQHGFIRPQTPDNTLQQARFLEEYRYNTPKYNDVIKWFETLPVYVDLPDFRVVHACWNDSALKVIKPLLTKEKTLKKSAFAAYERGVNPKFSNGINMLIKGPEFALPKDVSFTDNTGQTRRKTRLLWWEPKDPPFGTPINYMVEKGDRFLPFEGSDLKRAQNLRDKFNYAATEKPVFIGHYNIPQIPYLTAPNVACVNFKGHMVAYRWNEGDKGLSADNFVYV